MTTLVLAQAACDDDPTAPEDNNTLTEGEALALVNGFWSLALDPQLNLTTPACPGGGTISIVDKSKIEIDEANQKIVASVDVTLTPNACVFPGGELLFKVDGNPNIRQVGVLDGHLGGTAADLKIKITGTMDWELHKRSGSCEADLTIDGKVDDLSVPDEERSWTGTVSGRMCGIAVSRKLVDSEFQLTS